MSVLVTGSGGFVGGALARRLKRDGKSVVALLREFHGFQSDLWGVDGLHIAFGTVEDTDFIYRLLNDYAVESIFHLAAMTAVSACQRNPIEAWRANVFGTLGVLEAVRRYGKPVRMVAASSDKYYGDGPVPYREDQPPHAFGIYSTTKVAADVLARDFVRTYGLDISVVRSANVYGPGDFEFSRVVPSSIRRMLEGEPAILYGGAENMVREFVYIDDEVDAYLTVAAEGEPGEAYNVSGSGPVRVGDLVRILAEMCGGRVEVQPKDFREIEAQYLDSSKLQALGWAPKVGLERGLRKAVNWYRAYLGKAPEVVVT